MQFGVLIVLALLVLVDACQPPDCDTPDCGTCGNACCSLEFKFAVSPSAVFASVLSSLKAGGADKHYVLVNNTDLRPQKLPSGVQYSIQAFHIAAAHNDTLNMVLSSTDGKVTFLRGFSVSMIDYCDGGQNYKNLVGFIKGLAVAQLFAQKTLFGCTNGTNSTQII